jgi:hypothetical protein
MLRVIIVIGICVMMGAGVYIVAPYLKPSNKAFAPETPSSTVSPRLKGIFSGMKQGFSN